MLRLQLPSGLFPSLPNTLLSPSQQSALRATLTTLEEVWVTIPVEDRERFRLAQVTVPAFFAVARALCDAAWQRMRLVNEIDNYLEAFLEINRDALCGAQPL